MARTTDTSRRYYAAQALIARGAGCFELAQSFEEIAAGGRVGGFRGGGANCDPTETFDRDVPRDMAIAAVAMASMGCGLDEVSP